MDSSWATWRTHRVSGRTILAGIGVTATASLGAIMVVMNPSQAAYETYATQKVLSLLDQNICKEAPQAFELQQNCKAQLTSNRSQIQQFIANNTYHQNFIFFSVYTTDVSVSSFLPSYRVETVGAFRKFHVYDTAQN